ncbi:hypothetical protein, partial [Agrococcus sp. HG114]|uniref:hypothetical protein n=1 Tax=Agrococcus sp. HG114 TaxID=2969757 RepID=UPI00215B5498
ARAAGAGGPVVSGEDELRRRLQEIPGPRAGLDADAVVERARRRRRPKVAAVTAAATGAGVLIVAPFVLPGLSPLSPSSSVLSDRGAGQEQAPAAEQDSSGDAGAAGAAPAADACAIEDAETALGVDIAFGDDPGDGVADVAFTFLEDASLRVDGIGVAFVERGTGRIVEAPDPADPVVDALRGSARVGAVAGGGGGAEGSVVLGVRLVVADSVACSEGSEHAAPAPVVWLTDSSGAQRVVVGDPFGVR